MAPSNASKRARASRLREFKDADQEYEETGNKEAALRRFRGMRSKDTTMEDFVYAAEIIEGRDEEERNRKREQLRKLQFTGWRPEEPSKDKEG